MDKQTAPNVFHVDLPVDKRGFAEDVQDQLTTGCCSIIVGSIVATIVLVKTISFLFKPQVKTKLKLI